MSKELDDHIDAIAKMQRLADSNARVRIRERYCERSLTFYGRSPVVGHPSPRTADLPPRQP